MVQRARRLRRDMTDAERMIWRHLRASQLGVKFRRQMWLGGFVPDFASVEAKLVVEIDGGQHDADRRKDARRAAAMARLGYRTLRFWNNEVLENVDGVLRVISDAIPSPQPLSPNGRGASGPRCAIPSPGPGRGRGPPRSGGRVRE